MRRYPKYKASGIDWFGDIPEGWGITKLKFLTSTITKGTTPSTVGRDFVDEGINYLKVESISDVGTILPEKCSYIDEETHKILLRSKLKERDIVISIAGAIGRVAIISKDILPANTNQAVGIIRLRKKFENQKWITYLLNSEPILNHYKLEVVETAQANLSLENVGIVELTNPPLSEQHSIVRFLDYKTGQIDSFIANRQKQIELLKEQKAGIINKAVTKGINPNAKMKDSGIEWIGEVPEHWVVTKVKFVAKLQSGDAITADNIKEIGEYPVYGGNGLRGYTNNFTNNGEYILIGRQGALCGNINYAANKFWASEHAVVAYLLKPTSILWFGELLRTMNLNQYSQAAAQPGLSVDRIKNLPIPCTDYEEQLEIEEYIKTETSTVDTLISKYQKQIDLMHEYRTSLISQAVTGKIDVRKWEPKREAV